MRGSGDSVCGDLCIQLDRSRRDTRAGNHFCGAEHHTVTPVFAEKAVHPGKEAHSYDRLLPEITVQ